MLAISRFTDINNRGSCEFTCLMLSLFKEICCMTSTSKSVLIIEDEEDAAELFAEMMRVSGFRVLKTTNSAPAIDMMTADRPDVVILDIMMPDTSGLDILRQMRRDPELSGVPVVVVSAKSMPADIKNGMEAGASTYLTKPVGFLDLKEAVERALKNKPG